MNRLQQAKVNQILYGLRPQKVTGIGNNNLKVESNERFIARVEKEITERMITDVLKSQVALARVSGPIKKR